ncbi:MULTISPECIES: sigma-54-dependent Fis family transcriptional regulator [unclassified Peribacillus]|uniref:sigma-54-dependent Fis family transcriptional regulator n=1 Tax=unclassified Peribacillus TaxID=2675266 RepID=UPI001F4E0B23|nr:MULTISPECIES: sigma 54-interacting transcriptional regulator [unclassified Peribacillus]MCK1985988.1 sigma 54-interacting transcriptional regulator [Peribacillus sp. Aquil_B1]MCK2011211.1 sigma 54-interacting transcriptional regulator [Peribacillus sp. Aquil_B8]
MSLQMIQKLTQDIAEAIRAAFNIDVEIIDHQLKRVAATGFARKKVGQNMLFGTACREVLAKGRPIIIRHATQHKICKICPGLGKCTYVGGIVTPVYLRGKVIGTINIVAYEEVNMENIYDARQGILDFIEKMAELIESKIMEKEFIQKKLELLKEIEEVANFNPNGLLMTDNIGVIKYGNNLSFSLLEEDQHEIYGKNIFDLFQNFPEEIYLIGNQLQQGEISLKLKVSGTMILGEYKQIMNDHRVTGVMFSFQYLSHYNTLSLPEDKIQMNDIQGSSKAFQEIKLQALKFAKHSSTILLTGENGTGKDLFAQAIHNESSRNSEPFIAINCAAIPENLIESELFGYEKGAFTGANNMGKIGKFELANKGTIFLDEIGTMPLYLQAKLLRVIQNRQVDRIGGKESRKIDIRIIAATNESLQELVNQGTFRKDLYYRLHVIPLHLPPLRERKEDILLLARGFIKKFKKSLCKSGTHLTTEAEKLLDSYPWPGNVRELENIIEYAMNDVPPNNITISSENFPAYFYKAVSEDRSVSMITESTSMSLEDMENEMIRSYLRNYGWSTKSKRLIAQKLNISVATLYRKIKKYQI